MSDFAGGWHRFILDVAIDDAVIGGLVPESEQKQAPSGESITRAGLSYVVTRQEFAGRALHYGQQIANAFSH